MKDEGTKRKFNYALEQRKAHRLLKSPYVNTTGNIDGDELCQYLARARDELFEETNNRHKFDGAVLDIPQQTGVIVLIDEATKDHEFNIWSAVTNPRWTRKVFGFAMFSDPCQLAPVNMSTQKYNEHSSYGNITLQTRHLNENFRHNILVEQNRAQT